MQSQAISTLFPIFCLTVGFFHYLHALWLPNWAAHWDWGWKTEGPAHAHRAVSVNEGGWSAFCLSHSSVQKWSSHGTVLSQCSHPVGTWEDVSPILTYKACVISKQRVTLTGNVWTLFVLFMATISLPSGKSVQSLEFHCLIPIDKHHKCQMWRRLWILTRLMHSNPDSAALERGDLGYVAQPLSGSVVKNPPANAGDSGDIGSIPGLERFPWSRKWQPAPVFLPGKFHGQRSLAGYSPWGHKNSDTTEHACMLNLSVPQLYGTNDSLASEGC